ncbi:MAG: insulinase family protein [Chitinophagia bacterium]|jgi:predicted Zn-dependent peptidase|nr:insulinase family protein [Chitinophagia bacterium]NCA29175.1 insulinase family protein [Chitinophagia bacterium]
MIQFEKFQLDNGLKVLVHQDTSTPMAVVNVLYNVGAKDEDPVKTGFAHLFEHLMFGGSVNIPVYDEPLQRAGGENNAYTTNDLTNYYCQLPAENIETAFWLESDRMLSLAFSKKSLEVQRKVVCEEFKEHYINKPYGDAWHKMRSLAYTKHPYRWMTIGASLAHVEDATMEDVKDFFFQFYRPNNAILVVTGNVQTEQVKQLAEKWFGPIEAGKPYVRNLPKEPVQEKMRSMDVRADVPLDMLMMTWHMGGRFDEGYHATDLITEVLGGGTSARLYERLIKVKQIFSSIDCYHFGTVDPGLLVIEGKLVKGISMAVAEKAVLEEIEKIKNEILDAKEVQKVINKTESVICFEDMSIMNRAHSLAFYELLGDADLMNKELGMYQKVTPAMIQQTAQKIFQDNNRNTLYYYSKS